MNPKPTLLTIQHETTIYFRQGEFLLLLTTTRNLTQKEAAAVQETVSAQLRRKKLKANVRLPLEDGNFQDALSVLTAALGRLT